MHHHASDRGDNDHAPEVRLDPLLRVDRVQQLPVDSLLFFLTWPTRRRRSPHLRDVATKPPAE